MKFFCAFASVCLKGNTHIQCVENFLQENFCLYIKGINDSFAFQTFVLNEFYAKHILRTRKKTNHIIPIKKPQIDGFVLCKTGGDFLTPSFKHRHRQIIPVFAWKEQLVMLKVKSSCCLIGRNRPASTTMNFEHNITFRLGLFVLLQRQSLLCFRQNHSVFFM